MFFVCWGWMKSRRPGTVRGSTQSRSVWNGQRVTGIKGQMVEIKCDDASQESIQSIPKDTTNNVY